MSRQLSMNGRYKLLIYSLSRCCCHRCFGRIPGMKGEAGVSTLGEYNLLFKRKLSVRIIGRIKSETHILTKSPEYTNYFLPVQRKGGLFRLICLLRFP